MFKKGQSGNPKGGNKSGAGGRPADWLRDKCQALIDKHDLIGFLVDVATGKDIDQVVTSQGECLKVPAGVKERLKALEMLVDRGYGKVAQPIEGEIRETKILVMRPVQPAIEVKAA